MAEKNKGGVAAPPSNPFTRDIANISVVGRANKGAVGDYAEIRSILSRRNIKIGKSFDICCPYCPDALFRRFVCEALAPGYLTEYASPSLRFKLDGEKSLRITPIGYGEAFFHCINCEVDNGARLHMPDHPERYCAEGLMELFTAADRERRR
jgi:hypothetical protein